MGFGESADFEQSHKGLRVSSDLILVRQSGVVVQSDSRSNRGIIIE